MHASMKCSKRRNKADFYFEFRTRNEKANGIDRQSDENRISAFLKSKQEIFTSVFEIERKGIILRPESETFLKN
jgi:hypothetical protein